MTLRALLRVGLPAALVVLLYDPARAAVDLTGHFIGAVHGNFPTSACTFDSTQNGTAFAGTTNCPSINTTSSGSGTIDPSTGNYSTTGSANAFCTAPGSLVVNGMGASDSYSFHFDFTCGAFSGSGEGSRCGNGVLDAGEDQACDDAGAGAFASARVVRCCNSHCQLLPSGTPCSVVPTSFGSVGPCDAPGFCTGSSPTCPDLKQPDGTPCDDGNPCTTNTTCSAGSCIGTPAPAGTACPGAAAACRSSCRQQLVECKRTCAGSGQTRRECRAACAARSTCTAPGAPIRTLAYVVTECGQDPQGFFSSRQKLLVRHGNCDPVPVKEFDGGAPTPDPGELCRTYGGGRSGAAARASGRFQRLAVLPDGSGVVFEVRTGFLVSPGAPPPEEGFFFVRATGGELRPLGPASRVQVSSNDFFPVSPDGREIAFIDLGPDAAGDEAPQMFVLDVRSGRRRQLTHQSDPTICCQRFLNSRTITYHGSSAFIVKTNGKRPEKAIPEPVLVEGSHVVPNFTVTSPHPQLLYVGFPGRPAVNGGQVSEMFLLDGKDLLQLTNFGRNDTFMLGGFIAGGRVLFPASPDLLGGNPGNICQLFSIDTFGAHLRQLTHLPSDGRPANGCTGGGDGCGLSTFFLDRITGTVLFSSSCDPVGANPFGEQVFAMRPDGTGLRQLTNARGMTTDSDGTIHVELPGPFAYTSRAGG
jgi:hypothetical protein